MNKTIAIIPVTFGERGGIASHTLGQGELKFSRFKI
jgi:hypothetical protein